MPKMHQNTFGGRAPPGTPDSLATWGHTSKGDRREGRYEREDGKGEKGNPLPKIITMSRINTAVMDCKLRAGWGTEWRETWWVVRHRSVWPMVSAAGRRRRPAG